MIENNVEREMLDYGIFRTQLESGSYTTRDLYKYIIEHVGHENGIGYFLDSDGFYFLDASIQKICQKMRMQEKEIARLTKEMEQHMLIYNAEVETRENIDNLLLVKDAEIARLNEELSRYSKIIDVKEEWALQNEKQRDDAQAEVARLKEDVRAPIVESLDTVTRPGNTNERKNGGT